MDMKRLFPAALLLLATALPADEVLLKNGDRITGEVVKSEDDSLIVTTSYAGDLTIKMSEIRKVVTKETMILLSDERLLHVNELDLSKEPDTDADLIIVNPEPWIYGEGYKLKGIVNLAVELKEGNTNSDEFDLEGNFELRRQHDRFRLAGEFEFDKAAGVISKNKQWLVGNWDYFPEDDARWGFNAKRWYYGLTASLERDELADLRLRAVFGPHVGYQFFESKAMNLLLEGGPAYTHEDFTDDDSDRNYGAAAWSLNFDRYLFDEFTQFYHKQTGLLEIGGNNKLVHKSWTGFRFPLVGGFIASAEIKLDYDGEPAEGKDELDTTYNFKLGYSW